VRCCRYLLSSAPSSTLDSSQQIAYPSRNLSITFYTRCYSSLSVFRASNYFACLSLHRLYSTASISPHVTLLPSRYPLIRDRRHPLPVKNRAIAYTLTSAHLRLAVSLISAYPISITNSTISSSRPSRLLFYAKSVMLHGIPMCSMNTTPGISTLVPNADITQINSLSSIHCASNLGQSSASA
jgi:hypothetical protein